MEVLQTRLWSFKIFRKFYLNFYIVYLKCSVFFFYNLGAIRMKDPIKEVSGYSTGVTIAIK